MWDAHLPAMRLDDAGDEGFKGDARLALRHPSLTFEFSTQF